jgi:RHS repeat-associated protein
MDWQNSMESSMESSMENDSNTHGRLWFLLSALFSRVSISLVVAFAVITSTVSPVALAARVTEARYSKVPAKSATNTQSGETVTFYGPRRFDRLSGSPVTVTEQFPIAAGVNPPYTIQIQNGAADGTHRVSSATIHLNGVELFTQNAIKDTTPSLSQTVILQSLNTLQVKLTSAVGSFLTISFTGVRDVLPASLASIAPTRATQGQSLAVTLQGQNTHWVQGQTRASFGPEVSVNGAAAGELGNVTVTSFTTAIAQVSVSATAALSPRTVKVVTPNVPINLIEETVSLTDAFTVVATSPPGPTSTNVTTIAGLAGVQGFADGPASQARFKSPAGVAIGLDDSLYIADAGNNRIRVARLTLDQSGHPQWMVSTLAGDGTYGFADGPATTAQFKNPQGVAVDANGVVFVADTSNNRIRRIALDGTVTTVAGDGTAGLLDGPGNQARFNSPRGIAVDQQGNIYVADTGNAAVRLINSGGQVSTLAGDGTIGSSDSPPRFDCPAGVAVNGSTVYVYLADKGNHRIRRLDASGTVITLAGQGRGFADGSATDARFAEPSGITIDGSGKILVTDAINSLIRQVDPTLAANASPNAVSTLAGSGERGSADGTGNVAAFLTPRGIASTISSAIIVADTGNHTLRRLLLPPVIKSVTPLQGHSGDTITITGERFDGLASNRNTVRFARSAVSGGGQTTALVTAATRTELTVVVPEDATTGPVSVQTEGGTAVSADNFVVLPNPPVISNFSPQSGPVGTIVTLTGTRLKVDSGTTGVTFAGEGTTRLPALISSISSTEVRVNVPMGAVTGPIELTTPNGTAVTNGSFNVELSQDFEVTAAPSAIPAVERGTGTGVIHVTSAQPTFTQLASLSAVGLPAGVQARFDAPQITAGATSTLSLLLANSTVTAGSYSFTIRAVASIDGRQQVRTATATLNVIAAGQTTLSGRVLSTSQEPVVGATVSLDGRTSTTDAAGAFLLSGVTAGTNRPVMVDGRTASAPNRTYPVILEPATVIAGQANVVPFIFYLPPIDIQYEVELVAGQNTVAGNQRVPGLQMTVPAGANLRNRDGSPVARVSITPLAIDRTPSPLPANVSTALVYTSQPGGAIADIAMPVVYPNNLGAEPGTRLELYAFNHDTVQWYIYGYGRVSADGRTISPEIDPATGRPYGLRDFSWHFPNGAGPDGNPNDKDCENRGPTPVDYSTGIKVETMVDVSFGGARGGLSLTRTYTSDLARRGFVGRFGRGIKDNFDIRLSGSFQVGGAGRYVTSEQLSGRLFGYTRTETDGTLVFSNAITASQQGATIRKLTSGALEYRDKSGALMRFDSSGRITSTVDRNGNTTTYTYTGGNLTSVTDAVGRSIVFTYNGPGQVSEVRDPLGRITKYGYDSNLRLISVTDPAGGVTSYTYDTSGFFGTNHLLSITDPRGNRVKEITYDGNGRVIAQLFANSGVERYSYTLSGGLVTSTTITDVLGRTEVKRFNANGYTIGTVDSLGQVSTTERDLTNNLPLSRSGPCGCPETSSTYDANGNVTSTTDRLNQTTRFEYHPVFNTITKVIDALTKQTVMEYDARGNLEFLHNALNQTTTYRYDSFGQLIEIIDPLTHKTRFEYDEFGNVEAMIDPLNHRTEYEYDQVGRLIKVTDPLGRRTTNQYDLLDGLISVTDSAGDPTYFTYDRNGNLTAIRNSLGKRWTNAYDESNRVVLRTDPLGRQVRAKYNVGDEVTLMSLPSGRSTSYEYDQRGQLTSITDSLGNKVTFAYDNRGNRTSLTDQRGNTTTYTFDELFRPTTRRDPLGQVMTLSYNAMGNVREATDRMGRRVVIDYDDLHRPSIISFADATVNYTYDEAGRPKRIVDSQSGSIEWIYDEANRMVSETTAAGGVTYGYNDADQRTSMLATGSAPVVYGYDPAGRLETITQGSDVFTYSYDALSRLSGIQRPNGVRTTYAYDVVERLSRLAHTNAAGQTIEDYRYTYTADDQIASITSIASGQLLPNAKTASQADAGNRVSQNGSANFSFDPEGQTTSKSDPQGPTSYQWDGRGRLTQVQLPDGQSVSYGYDAIGRLSSRTSGGSTTSYLYDRLDVVRDTGSDGSRIDYINGPGTDKKLRQSSAGEGSYFLQDHLGSTIALTDAGGNVLERQSYEPFGAGTASSRTRFGYTGRERDPSTGLLHYRARWQDPEQGRFLTEDPIGYSGGGNVYAYVGNNPLTFVDPLGLSWQTFLEGLLVGGLESLLYAAVFAVIFSALTAATAGTALAVIPPALSLLLTAGAAISVAEQIAALLTEDMCPDEWHYRAGVLIASAAIMIIGGARSRRGGRPEPETGSRPPYKRSDYKNPSPSRRKEVLDKNPTCRYCGNRKSTDFEHIKSNKQDYNEGGWKEPRDVRSDRQNSDPNNTGACKSCNGSKGSKELGPGPGQWWPPNWPTGSWWPFGGP